MSDLGNSLDILLICSGIAVWIAAALKVYRGMPLLPYRERAAVVWSPVVLAVAGAWVTMTIVLVVVREPASKPSLRVVQINALMNVLLTGVLLMLLAGKGSRKLSEFGITLKSWRQDTVSGGWGFLAAIVPVFFVVWITQPLRSEESEHVLLKLLKESPQLETVLWIGLSVVILAPVAEELIFRVILQGVLRSRLSANGAIAISSLMFVSVHRFPDSLALLPLAVLFGYVYERRHSYLAVVVMHALFNLTNLVLALLSAGA